jgi:hypothetical protein
MLRKLSIWSWDQKAGQNNNTKTGNKAFEREEQFKHLETTLIIKNSIHEEIKSRLELKNTCYHSMQKYFVFQFTIQKCKDWDVQNYDFACHFCMAVKLGHSRQRRNVGWGFSRTGCWGQYFGLRGMRWQGSGDDYITRSFMFCTPCKTMFG